MMWGNAPESQGFNRLLNILSFRLLTVMLGAITWTAYGQEGDAAGADQEQIGEGELVEAIQLPLEHRVRDALTNAVMHFRERSRKDSDGFILPPVRQRQVIDWEEVEVRYSRRTVEVPIYEYETYKTVGRVRDSDSVAGATQLGTVTRRRRTRQIGTRKEERLVRDEHGDVVRTERRPIWGAGGPDYLFPGWWGQNGLAIYACLKVGVPPHDEQLATGINILTQYLDGYRLPDRTFDLAWLTAAYVNLPKDNPEYEKWARLMVNKLLLGQIREGEAAGMWGPVAVNTDLLGKMMAHEQEVFRRQVEPWQQRLRDNPTRDRYKERLEEARQVLNKFHLQFDLVTQQGLEFEHVRQHHVKVNPVHAATERIDWLFREVHVRGLPFFIYGENLADVENTSIALFALAEARRNGYLPDETSPPLTVEGQPVIRPEPTRAILERAIEAVAKRQTGSGTCTENNHWFAVNSFNDVGIANVPYERDHFRPLQSSLTFSSTALANAALADAIRALEGLPSGPARFGAGRFNLDPYRRKYSVSRRMTADMANAILDGQTRGLEVGYHSNPYGYLFQLTRATTGVQPDRETLDRSTWVRYAERIMEKQADGVWGERHEVTPSSSVREYFPALYTQRHEVRQRTLPLNERGEIDRDHMTQRVRNERSHYGLRFERDVAETAYAMLFLAGGMRPPMAGAWSWNDAPPRTLTLESVVARIGEENDTQLQYSIVPASLPLPELESLPVLFASGIGTFEPARPDSLQNLQHYLSRGGLLALEAPANPEGETFLSTAKEILLEALPGVRQRTLRTGDQMADLTVLVGSEGRPVVLLLPVGDSADGSALTAAQEVELVSDLLQRRVDPAYMRDGFFIDWAAVQEADEMRAQQAAEEAAAAFLQSAIGDDD